MVVAVPDRAEVIARLRAAGCVFAEEEADLILEAATSPEALAAMLERRVEGAPLEPLLGWVAFGGLRIALEPQVFVPRRRTELLAREALALASAAGAEPVVVELCCGEGAIGAVICDRMPAVELHAADVDPVAVRCARRNVVGRGGQVYAGDLYEPLPRTLRGRVDVLVANPPYVPTQAIGMMPPEARDHEPRAALDGGADGLDVLRRLVEQAPEWLAPGGHLLLELGADQVPAAAAACDGAGLAWRVAHDDDLGATVVVAGRPA